jgi:hypothetical protein
LVAEGQRGADHPADPLSRIQKRRPYSPSPPSAHLDPIVPKKPVLVYDDFAVPYSIVVGIVTNGARAARRVGHSLGPDRCFYSPRGLKIPAKYGYNLTLAAKQEKKPCKPLQCNELPDFAID